MREIITALAVVIPISAQWINYPTAGVPHAKDGKANLFAPAPKTSDGKPDLSGIWSSEHNRPCPPDGCPDQQAGQEFIDISWRLPGGLPDQPWAADLAKKNRAANSND